MNQKDNTLHETSLFETYDKMPIRRMGILSCTNRFIDMAVVTPSPPHPPRNHNNSNNPYPYNELYQNDLRPDLRFNFIKDLWRFARTLTTASHNNARLGHVTRRIVQIGLLTFEIRSLEELFCRDFDYVEGETDVTKSMRGGIVKEKEDVS